ncbi:MAG TPA: MFS transporter [Burkholderiales bacterium]|nr:MFS transporter [Burkholderiales bacterium]
MTQSRRTQLFLNVGHTLDHLFLLIYPTVVLAMAPQFGRSYGEMLALSLGAFIAFGAGSLPAGWLADRWSRRGMMILFFVGIGCASILTAAARTPWQIAAALTLIGVFGSIYHPVGVSMLVSGREKVGKVLGVNGVFGNLGLAFSALISGALAQWFGWQSAFIVPGIISIGVGIAFARVVPRDPVHAKAARKVARFSIPREVLLRAFLILTVSTICGGVIFNSNVIAMPKVFDERLSALVSTTLGVGVLVSAVYAFAAMAQLCVGYLLDRFSIKPVFMLIAAVQVPLLLLAAAASNYVMLGVALIMMFFVFGQIPINDAMVAAYTDEQWRSRVYAVRYVVSFGASALSVPLVALISRMSSDFSYLFVLLAGLAFAMFIAALYFPAGSPRLAPQRA